MENNKIGRPPKKCYDPESLMQELIVSASKDGVVKMTRSFCYTD
ncbi:hypothetical protein [Enterocloster clostridioformis]|uniref:Uncharacterized protein n=1 Tax=Enterocloster clostridioformis TaxID=1531 RepID=A0A2X2UCE0_9FIRM|nr:hypothetical protein [Enterocloster clostridioformis]SQB14108.1 Uncharacterised protein [Enterocloster clostridioformis]